MDRILNTSYELGDAAKGKKKGEKKNDKVSTKHIKRELILGHISKLQNPAWCGRDARKNNEFFFVTCCR